MQKIHILLVEKNENKIKFFTEALAASGLKFMCNTAKNTEQASKILKNSVPDAIFINTNILQAETGSIKEITPLQKVPVIFYSAVLNQNLQLANTPLHYVQLPRSINTMAYMLKNLFIDNRTYGQPGFA